MSSQHWVDLVPNALKCMSRPILRGVIVPGVPSGDRGNWEKESLRDRSHACFAKKAYEIFNLEPFRNVSVHEFYCIKVLITLEQVNTTEWSKQKKKNLKTAMVECCKLSLYANGWVL